MRLHFGQTYARERRLVERPSALAVLLERRNRLRKTEMQQP